MLTSYHACVFVYGLGLQVTRRRRMFDMKWKYFDPEKMIGWDIIAPTVLKFGAG